MALAGFGVMPWDEAEDDGMFGGMLVAEADDDGHVVSNRATPPCFFHAMLSHALTMPSPWHCDALLLMIVSVLRSLPAQRQAVFNGEAKAGRNVGAEQKAMIIDELDIISLIASDEALAAALRSIDGDGDGWNLACQKGSSRRRCSAACAGTSI